LRINFTALQIIFFVYNIYAKMAIKFYEGISKRQATLFNKEQKELGYDKNAIYGGQLTKRFTAWLKKNLISDVQVGKVFNPKTGRFMNDTPKNKEKVDKYIKEESKKRKQNALRERIASRVKQAKEDFAKAKKNTVLDFNGSVYELYKMVGDTEASYNNIRFSNKFLFKLDKIASLNKSGYIQISINKEIIRSTEGIIQFRGGDGLAIWWNCFQPLLKISYEDNIFARYERENSEGDKVMDIDNMKRDKIRIWAVTSNSVIPEYIKQRFKKDTNNLCVLKAIRKFANKKFEEAGSSSTERKWASISRNVHQDIQAIENSEEEYYGIPEDELETVAKKYHIRLHHRDLFGNTVCEYNKSARNIVPITNVSPDHVELGYVVLNKDMEYVSQEKLIEKINKFKEEGRPFLSNGKIRYTLNGNKVDYTISPTKLCIDKNTYVLANPLKDVFDEMNEENNIRSFNLDACKYPELNNFLRDCVTVHSTPILLRKDGNTITNKTRHFDIAKCYTQADNCKFYQGFPRPTRARSFPDNFVATKEFLKNHLGFYNVTLIDYENLFEPETCDMPDYLKPYELSVGRVYNLFSPEILMLMSEGCQFIIHYGAFQYGSGMDIEYTEDMLTKKDADGNKAYALWAGKQGSQSDYDSYLIPADNNWSKMIAYQASKLGGKVEFFAHLGMCQVLIPKKTNNTRHHLFASITSYARLNVVELMKNIVEQGGKLKRCVLDGVYFEDKDGDIEPEVAFDVHTDKDIKQSSCHRSGWFEKVKNTYHFTPYNKDIDSHNRIYLTGQGGSGKSYSILMDKGIIQCMYVAPSNILCGEQYKKYKCSNRTYAKMEGHECQPYYSESGIPYNILFDESTQITEDTFKQLEEDYCGACIFIAGDVKIVNDKKLWFQTRNGNPHTGFNSIYIPDHYHYVEFKNDYRSLDKELALFKLQVRELMEAIFKTGSQDELHQLMDEVYKLPLARKCFIKEADALKLFKQGEDICIVGTKKKIEDLEKKGIISGYKNNKTKMIYNEPTEGCKAQSAFTIHSFQGATRESGNIFIYRDLFEWGMFYTAISRARYFSQIKLVSNNIRYSENNGLEHMRNRLKMAKERYYSSPEFWGKVIQETQNKIMELSRARN